MTQLDTLLKSGIQALKAGNKPEARRIFLHILEQDDRHEMAWLWLSGCVTNPEEQLVCLENVLQINPENRHALQGLAKLRQQMDWAHLVEASPQEAASSQIVSRERPALSPAAALLYPERRTQSYEWKDPTNLPQTASKVGFMGDSQYDDVWVQAKNLCPFCATAVTVNDHLCPRCQQPITIKQYRYENPSANLHIFWVLLLGIANINLVQLLFDLIVWQDLLGLIINGLFILTFMTLAIGTYFRRFWAFLGSQITLLFVLVTTGARWLFPLQITSERFPDLQENVAAFVVQMGSGTANVLIGFELIAVIFALLYAIFLVAPDFDRIDHRRVAAASRKAIEAGDFHMTAKRAAAQHMWATAVLNWQRAAAREPDRHQYLRHLTDAYLRLGFYQRAADVLQFMIERTTHPEKLATLQQQKQAILAQLNEP